MFGHNHDDPQQDNPDVPPPEPVEDGTLGVPAPDDGNGGMNGGMPGPTNDDGNGTPAPALSMSRPQGPQGTTPLPTPGGTSDTSDDLISIKQSALQELKPLVGHLDQTPEEKFRTTMMMIQASDDQSLIPDAYNAAKGISDDKTRAQALLDVVNEINYFTTQKG